MAGVVVVAGIFPAGSVVTIFALEDEAIQRPEGSGVSEVAKRLVDENGNVGFDGLEIDVHHIVAGYRDGLYHTVKQVAFDPESGNLPAVAQPPATTDVDKVGTSPQVYLPEPEPAAPGIELEVGVPENVVLPVYPETEQNTGQVLEPPPEARVPDEPTQAAEEQAQQAGADAPTDSDAGSEPPSEPPPADPAPPAESESTDAAPPEATDGASSSPAAPEPEPAPEPIDPSQMFVKVSDGEVDATTWTLSGGEHVPDDDPDNPGAPIYRWTGPEPLTAVPPGWARFAGEPELDAPPPPEPAPAEPEPAAPEAEVVTPPVSTDPPAEAGTPPAEAPAEPEAPAPEAPAEPAPAEPEAPAPAEPPAEPAPETATGEPVADTPPAPPADPQPPAESEPAPLPAEPEVPAAQTPSEGEPPADAQDASASGQTDASAPAEQPADSGSPESPPPEQPAEG